MAQSLGTVTKNAKGGFEGMLAMLTLTARITIAPNEAKENDLQPDYRIYAANNRGSENAEIGGGWNRISKRSGKPYVSLTFAHPALGPSKVYANLARAAGQNREGVMAILWNPKD